MRSRDESTGTKKLRVGFDARWYNDSGVGTYVAQILRAMAAEPERIDLVVYEASGNPVPGLMGAAVERISVRAPKYSIAEQFELRGRAREDKLDIFHSPFYRFPRRMPCPVVVTLHDVIPFRFPIYQWPKSWLVKMGYRSAARDAEHIVAVSENTARDVKEVLGVEGNRLTTVLNGVARDCFHPQASSRETDSLFETYDIRSPYVVVASARNWRTKNLEAALLALQRVREQINCAFQTVIYGPPDGLNAAGGEARWPGLKLVRTGPVSPEILGALFRHARVFVMPSLYEGFGLPVLEAMSCGCAVVASNAGSLAEIAADGAQTFAPDDTDEMARAISGLLLSREERDHWRAAALRRASDFCWQNAARETISVYHRTRNSV